MHIFPTLEAIEDMNEIIVNPGESIQQAINDAIPGTIIRVKAGTYREALSLFQDVDGRKRITTPEKPIVLISEDGPGKAIIQPPDNTQEPTLFLRLGNTVVSGFKITGTAGFEGDNAPLKIGSKEGNILIKDNYIESTAEDVIKVVTSKGISFIGNTLDTGETEPWKDEIPDNNYLKDSGIDIVHAKDITIKNNDFIGNVATGITMKTGTNNVDISNNYFTGKYLDAAIKVGGRGDSFAEKDPWLELPESEADNIRVTDNVIEGEFLWDRVFLVRGGQNSTIAGNFIFPKTEAALYRSEQSNSSDWSEYYKGKDGWFNSENISFLDNVLSDKVMDGYAKESLTGAPPKLPQNQGFVERGNSIGTLQAVDFPVGAGDQPVGLTPKTIPAPTSPTAEPSPGKVVILQADDATLDQATLETEHSGLMGSGYINFDNVSDSGANWTFNSTISDGQLTIRYANGSSNNRKMKLFAGGVEQGIIDFNSTGSWDTWKKKTMALPRLNKGDTIRLEAANPNSGPNIDQLIVDPSSSSESLTPEPVDPNLQSTFIGEYGRLALDHQWQTIELNDSYDDPVVLVSDPTLQEADPAVVRLRNIAKDSFQVRVQEPSYANNQHTQESVSYMVMEAGDWILADGTRISAGTHTTRRLTSQGFDAITLKEFEKPPTVLSQVQTSNGRDWVTTRTKGRFSDSFQISMQEEEALNSGEHTDEILGWVAIDTRVANDGDTLLEGKTTERTVNSDLSSVQFEQAFDADPSVIAKLSSYFGTDTANLRLDEISRIGFGVKVQEEQSRDLELSHTPESVSFLALEGQEGALTGAAI
ncbi:MAG: right-handed parallel beta-helix repeat-containing protein [Cyanobacteria bacterium P01_A01_bin.37]